MPRTAIYAGTFDPPTRGHVWMLQQAAGLFDTVVVAIGINPDKRTLFPLAEREQMLRDVSAHLPNVRVATFEHQYLIHYARSVGADVIVRGIRNGDDPVWPTTDRSSGQRGRRSTHPSARPV